MATVITVVAVVETLLELYILSVKAEDTVVVEAPPKRGFRAAAVASLKDHLRLHYSLEIGASVSTERGEGKREKEEALLTSNKNCIQL